ncbi:hypothetical protein Purlil1_9643 [Purpureocillium lilacinum]|uniref:Secreted protein n=1 Tax=Purpureocillium lilacinum TaxID=33203 RepID=A0ABR0BPZ9_PURLI|nr:hypothetical protein Purlil1_9643 [Purpureocillium lilacinum]
MSCMNQAQCVSRILWTAFVPGVQPSELAVPIRPSCTTREAALCKFVTSPSSASTSTPEGPATNARHFAPNKAKLGGDGVVK